MLIGHHLKILIQFVIRIPDRILGNAFRQLTQKGVENSLMGQLFRRQTFKEVDSGIGEGFLGRRFIKMVAVFLDLEGHFENLAGVKRKNHTELL